MEIEQEVNESNTPKDQGVTLTTSQVLVTVSGYYEPRISYLTPPNLEKFEAQKKKYLEESKAALEKLRNHFLPDLLNFLDNPKNDVETIKGSKSFIKNLSTFFNEVLDSLKKSYDLPTNVEWRTLQESLEKADQYYKILENPSFAPNGQCLETLEYKERQKALGTEYYPKVCRAKSYFENKINELKGYRIKELDNQKQQFIEAQQEADQPHLITVQTALNTAFCQACEKIRQDFNAAGVTYKGHPSPAINLLCHDMKLDPNNTTNTLDDKIAKIGSLKGWNVLNTHVCTAVNNLRAISEAHAKNLANIQAIIVQYSLNEKEFLAQLKQENIFSKLIDKIPEIQKRKNNFFQDLKKNDDKAQAITQLQNMLNSDETTLENVYRFMKENENNIIQSTRDDEGCLSTFFRNVPESRGYFSKIIETIETRFPDLKEKGTTILPPSPQFD